MVDEMGQKDKVRELLDLLPTPTPEQLAKLDEHCDPKTWGVMENMAKNASKLSNRFGKVD